MRQLRHESNGYKDCLFVIYGLMYSIYKFHEFPINLVQCSLYIYIYIYHYGTYNTIIFFLTSRQCKITNIPTNDVSLSALQIALKKTKQKEKHIVLHLEWFIGILNGSIMQQHQRWTNATQPRLACVNGCKTKQNRTKSGKKLQNSTEHNTFISG